MFRCIVPCLFVNLGNGFMQTVNLNNIVWQEGDYFVAQCLNVEVSSFGDTREEALLNLQEALELYFEDASLDSLSAVQNPEIVTTTFARA